MTQVSAHLAKYQSLACLQDLHTGYTPSESPANREFAIAREFYSKQGQPYYSAIFITANDNGSLFRPEYLE